MNVTRPVTNIPKTDIEIKRDQIDAEVAHEKTLEYFVHNTELGVVTEEQQSEEALLNGLNGIGINLPGTTLFFERQRKLSSGVRGIGRVQVKEVITAGSFPLSLLFDEKKSGIFDTIKSFMGGNKKQEESR